MRVYIGKARNHPSVYLRRLRLPANTGVWLALVALGYLACR